MNHTPSEKEKTGGQGRTILLAVLFGAAIMLILLLLANAALKNSQPSASTAVKQQTTTTTIPYATTTLPPNETAKTGDIVELDYMGQYPNRTVFDTSVEEIAKEAGIFIQGRDYQPIVVTVGMQEVVPGIENAIIGMRVGEEKTVTVTPDIGYGEWSAENIEELPLIQNTSRTESIPIDVFENTTGQKAVANTTIRIPEMRWSITILDMDESEVFIRHNPENGTIVPTVFGNTTLTVTDDRIYAKLGVKPKDKILTEQGYVTVINVTDETMTIDANHELAGQTVIFTLRLLSINQVADPYAEYILEMQAAQAQ
jgi:FKBP-type peptidyl-prolyl cis-trans isomerase 2